MRTAVHDVPANQGHPVAADGLGRVMVGILISLMLVFAVLYASVWSATFDRSLTAGLHFLTAQFHHNLTELQRLVAAVFRPQ